MTYEEATTVWRDAPEEVKTFVVAVLQEEAAKLRKFEAERTVVSNVMQARVAQVMSSVPGDPAMTGAALGLTAMTSDNPRSVLADYLDVVSMLLQPPADPPTGT